MGNRTPFPIKPETNEYYVLSFLIRNRGSEFSAAEIKNGAEIDKTDTSKTIDRLLERGLIESSDGVYYVDPDRADWLKQQLKSLDSAVQLFESTPTDDAYAEEGWEDTLPSIDTTEDW